MTSQRISRRAVVRGAAAGALLAAAGGAPAFAGQRRGRGGWDPAALRAAISDLTHPPSTAAQLWAEHGRDRWYGSTGVTELKGGRAPRPGDAFRAGSVTKLFVAVVVFQLWSEGRLRLDDPIGRHVPGWLPPASARITVQQLLDHTSGLPDHRGLPDLSTPEAVLRHRFDRWTPEEIVASVAHEGPKFPPGTAQEYRGINYVMLSLLIQELTGQEYGEAIAARVLRPLGLRRTWFPGTDPRLRGPHVHGYLRMSDGSTRDATACDPSSMWGEGELVSTVDDLKRFQRGLLNGELLSRAAMDQLFVLPPDSVRMLDGTPARYSTGLQRIPLGGGVTLWGKTGETYGYRTRVFTTRDQRTRFVLAYHPTSRAAKEEMAERVVAALPLG
ncbi:serine hydrolase domain-containing protein [Streptomyces spectabilis]|uniref:serine hydrolase domain-containing protein n=1 Tax=Streptomyces spectabilis TaxID=68270 RepID=UPI0033F4B9CB